MLQIIYRHHRLSKYNVSLLHLTKKFLMLHRPLIVPQISYQKGPLFCFVSYSPNETNLAVKLAIRTFYEGIPTLLAVIISLVGYISAIRRFKSLPSDIIELLDVNVYKLLWYPVVLILAFVPSMVDNFIQTVDGVDRAFFAKIIHIGCTHSIGFLNALIYGIQMRGVHIRNRSATHDVSLMSEDSEEKSVQISLVQAKNEFM